MPRIRLRPATVEDAPGIAVLHVAAWQAAYRGLLPDALLDGLSVDDRAARWVERLTGGSAVTLAEQDDQLLGFVSHGPSRDEDAGPSTGEIYALYVAPASWRVRIGTRLHSAALEAMSAAALTDAVLWVLEGNDRAQRFYEAHGWRPDGRLKVDEAFGAHVRYHRPLP